MTGAPLSRSWRTRLLLIGDNGAEPGSDAREDDRNRAEPGPDAREDDRAESPEGEEQPAPDKEEQP